MSVPTAASAFAGFASRSLCSTTPGHATVTQRIAATTATTDTQRARSRSTTTASTAMDTSAVG